MLCNFERPPLLRSGAVDGWIHFRGFLYPLISRSTETHFLFGRYLDSLNALFFLHPSLHALQLPTVPLRLSSAPPVSSSCFLASYLSSFTSSYLSLPLFLYIYPSLCFISPPFSIPPCPYLRNQTAVILFIHTKDKMCFSNSFCVYLSFSLSCVCLDIIVFDSRKNPQM